MTMSVSIRGRIILQPVIKCIKAIVNARTEMKVNFRPSFKIWASGRFINSFKVKHFLGLVFKSGTKYRVELEFVLLFQLSFFFFFRVIG